MLDDDPVVVGANRYRFSSGERIVNPHVMSVSFIWVLSGAGEILAGGRRFAVDNQHVVRLPWRHAVEYRASGRGPAGRSTSPAPGTTRSSGRSAA